MTKRWFTVGMVLMLSGAAFAQTPAPAADKQPDAAKGEQPKAQERAFDLMIGDKAPALAIEKWVKGDSVTGFEKGKVYVVEFWATWCGPCIAGMPHLSELQKEYKDKGVTIIGVTAEDPNNSLEDVKKMVAEKGDTMGYTVAWDNAGKTNDAYMSAAGQNGIPCAFVVNKEGVVAYIGHPARMDKALEEIVAGTYDLKKAAEAYATKMEPRAKTARIERKIRAATKAKDWDAVLAGYDEMAKAEPRMAQSLSMTKFNIMLLKAKNMEKASQYGREAVKAFEDNAQALNAIAWTIVDPKNAVEKPDLDLAMTAAAKADELSDHENAAILDTLARVHWLKGDKAKALEIQTKAVGLAEDEMKEDLEKTLAEYKKAGGNG